MSAYNVFEDAKECLGGELLLDYNPPSEVTPLTRPIEIAEAPVAEEVAIPDSHPLMLNNITPHVANSTSPKDKSPPLPSLNLTKRVSITETTYHMLSRHISNDNEEFDFPLYLYPNIFSHNFPFGEQNFNMDTVYIYSRI
jgi:hypothetical protein